MAFRVYRPRTKRRCGHGDSRKNTFSSATRTMDHPVLYSVRSLLGKRLGKEGEERLLVYSF